MDIATTTLSSTLRNLSTSAYPLLNPDTLTLLLSPSLNLNQFLNPKKTSKSSRFPRVQQGGWDIFDEEEDFEDEVEKEMQEDDSEMFWAVAEHWFYSVFFIGIFGIFVWFEMPLDIIAMLVHPNSKPCEAGYSEDEEPDAIQAAFNWTIQKTADMIHPQAYLISAVFTAGNAHYNDFDLCEFNHEEAALYFFVYWLIWPVLILVNLPMAVLLSPVYVIGLTIKTLELFIEWGEDGKEIN